MDYYVYAYLREDGTPYYIGKGAKLRAWKHSKSDITQPPADHSRIVLLYENLHEHEAFDLEIETIAEYGRIDLGTGILRNRTNGGDGASGVLRTTIECEQCNATVDLQNYKRWHGKNCTGTRNQVKLIGLKTCPHCGITCRGCNYTKYHGDNCKLVAPRKALPKIHCIHCDRFITNFNYPRHHGDKCKLNFTSNLNQSHIP